METILLLAILVIVIILLTSMNSKFKQLQDTVYRLHERINDLKNELSSKVVQDVSKTAPEIRKESVPVSKPIVEEKIIEKPIEVIEKTPEIIPVAEPIKVEIKEEIKQYVPIIEPEQPRAPQKSWFENFKENNPDLEKFIGENLINKIGILLSETVLKVLSCIKVIVIISTNGITNNIAIPPISRVINTNSLYADANNLCMIS